MKWKTDALPEAIQVIVERRTRELHFTSQQDYIASLILNDQDGAVVPDNIEELLLEGLNSGPGEIVDSNFWKRRAAEIREFGKIRSK